MGEAKWASGRWQVRAGMAGEFVDRWRAWIEASALDLPGFRSARLLQSEDDPLRFTSISDWDDDATLKAWKTSSAFQEGMRSTRELCDDFLGGDFDVAAVVTPPD